LTGSFLSNTALITENMAVFAPIPSAKVTSVARVNPGVEARRRRAYFKSRIKSYKRDPPDLYTVTNPYSSQKYAHILVLGIAKVMGEMIGEAAIAPLGHALSQATGKCPSAKAGMISGNEPYLGKSQTK
jgi:hypothetical protein